MATNTETNSASKPTIDRLLFSLLFIALAYSVITIFAHLSFSPAKGARLFAYWGATVASTSALVTVGFSWTSSVQEWRIFLHLLVWLQIVYGVFKFLPAFWSHLDNVGILYQVLLPVTALWISGLFVYLVDSAYVYATTPVASSGERDVKGAIKRWWVAHVPRSRNGGQHKGLPVTTSEVLETTTGDPQTCLRHTIQGMYRQIWHRAETDTEEQCRLQSHMLRTIQDHRRLPAQIDPERERLLDDTEVV